MPSNSVDPRVRRTKKSIRDALFTMIKQKSLAEITVRDLCEQADLNRTTFYLHYASKWDVLHHVIAEIDQAFTPKLESFKDGEGYTAEGLASMELALFEHIHSHLPLYRELLATEHTRPGIAVVRQCLEAVADNALAQVLAQTSTLDIPQAVIKHYFVSGYLGVITWWVNSKRPAAPEQMAAWMVALSAIQTRPS